MFLGQTLQVFQLRQDTNLGPIMGLEFRRFVQHGAEPRCFAIVTTPRRIYQFVGLCAPPGEQPVLQRVFNINDDVFDRCMEIPSRLRYSCLQLFSVDPKEIPTRFALMLEPGVYFGDVVLPLSGQDQKTVIFNPELLEYPLP